MDCDDPLRGKVEVVARPAGTEAVGIRNVSEHPVDLGDHVLKLRNAGKVGQYVFGHVFPRGTMVRPGGTFVYVHPTANRYSDRGGVLELRTLDDQLTECVDWGFLHC